MTKWIEYKVGDPIPDGKVRIRMRSGWESKNFSIGSNWCGWGEYEITHYIEDEYEPNPDTAEALRASRDGIVSRVNSVDDLFESAKVD